MKTLTKIFILIYAVLFFANPYRANAINFNELEKKIKNLPDTQKIAKYEEVATKYMRISPDTSYILLKQALKIARKNKLTKHEGILLREIGNSLYYQSKLDEAFSYYQKSLDIFKQLNDIKNEANVLKNIGIIYLSKGNFNKAIEYYKKSLANFNKIKDKSGLARTYLGLSAINFNIGNYSKALAYSQKSLRLFKELNDSTGMAMCYGNIGNIHADQGNHIQALKYYQNALSVLQNLGDKIGVAKTLTNIGAIYNDMNQYKKAIPEFEKALEIYKELDNKLGMAEVYSYMGKSYEKLENYKEAIKYYNKSLKIRKELDDKNGITQSYTFLSDLYFAQKRYTEAISYAEKAIKYAKEIGSVPGEKAVYETLYKIYEELGNYEKAFKYHKLFTATKDTLFNLEKVKALEELETKYQVEKTEQELEKQKILLQKKETEAEKQKFQRNAFIGGFLLMMLLALVIYMNLRQKKRSNILLAEQKAEIEAIHKELTSSITYAQQIQAASLASKSYLKNLLPEYFIIFRPRDMVSGDFYWWRKVGNKIFISVADCTGHGVPGALMSMLGLSLLKEAIINEKIEKPKDILEFMRTGILDIFAQQEKYNTQDGMDMAIIAINTENNLVEFAGANNPIFLIRTKEKELTLISDEDKERIKREEYDNCILYEVKPDRMPIGRYHKFKEFTQVEFYSNPEDMVYLMSDGFQDQFGGEKNKKFTKKRLKRLLSQIFDQPAKEQQTILEAKLDEWQNGYPQTDDITLMGIRLNIKQ